MKALYVTMFFSCLAVLSCNRKMIEPVITPRGPQEITLHISLPAATRTVRTPRAGYEDAVNDINVRLVNRTNPNLDRHYYLTSTADFTVSLDAGEYDYYAIANAGKDLSGLSSQEIIDYRFSVEGDIIASQDFSAGMPMSASGRCYLPGDTSLDISLKRCLAMLYLDIVFDYDFFSRIEMQSIQLLNVPSRVRCFGENRGESLVDYPPRPQYSGQENYTEPFFIPENMAGENTAITDPRQKNRSNAPQDATCLKITALCDGIPTNFFIYPGYNDTSDFNLRRNTAFFVLSTIAGADLMDTRISSARFSASAWMVPTMGSTGEGLVMFTVTNDPQNKDFTVMFENVQGMTSFVLDDQIVTEGIYLAPGKDMFVVPREENVLEYHIPYRIIPHAIGDHIARVTLKDSYGTVYSKDASYYVYSYGN